MTPTLTPTLTPILTPTLTPTPNREPDPNPNQARAQEDLVHRASTVLLLATVSTISLFLKDLGLVVAFGGAALPNALPNPSP